MLHRLLNAVRVRTVQAWPAATVGAGLQRPMATISFDDWPRSAWLAGGEILDRFGMRATFFTCAGLLGTVSTEFGYDHATAEDVRAAAIAGHEIACHTFSHLNCSRTPIERLEADFDRNRVALEDLTGQPVQSFAYPYGAVSLASKRVAARRFSSARGIRQSGNISPFDLAQLSAFGLERFRKGQPVGALAEATARSKGWLHLFTHDVSDDPGPFGCRPADLEEAVRAIAANGLDVVTQAEGTARVRAAAARFE